MPTVALHVGPTSFLKGPFSAKCGEFAGLQVQGHRVSCSWNLKLIFDSPIVPRTVCESMPSRVQKLLQWVVALENQHAIRAVCVCAFDFVEDTNKRRGWFIAGNFSLRHVRECHTYVQYHFSSRRLELFHLAHSRYFVKLEPTQGAYDSMDSRLLRSTSDMSELSQRQ